MLSVPKSQIYNILHFSDSNIVYFKQKSYVSPVFRSEPALETALAEPHIKGCHVVSVIDWTWLFEGVLKDFNALTSCYNHFKHACMSEVLRHLNEFFNPWYMARHGWNMDDIMDDYPCTMDLAMNHPWLAMESWIIHVESMIMDDYPWIIHEGEPGLAPLSFTVPMFIYFKA